MYVCMYLYFHLCIYAVSCYPIGPFTHTHTHTHTHTQFENNVYIGVGQSGEDSEQLITRRVLVFHSVVSFLYGPAVDR